ncbi:MAG TPA: hypothetical protein VK571_10115, partial [Gemmatimonadaceae bacterium]|nr:hypothetical protein [Gemmatimonadaceae bacterium]
MRSLTLIVLLITAMAANVNAQQSAPGAVTGKDWSWKTSNLREDPELNADALKAHQALCERTG